MPNCFNTNLPCLLRLLCLGHHIVPFLFGTPEEGFPELAHSLIRQGKRVAALARTSRRPLLDDLVWLAAPADAAGYAHDLYANLRRLDHAGCDAILVEQPPEQAEWIAIRDRLNRAAAGSGETEGS